MTSKRPAARAAWLLKAKPPMRSHLQSSPFSSVRALQETAEEVDPDMNGGYINPTNHPHPLKRSLRDPYHPWWDKQERRDFGEPLHEDNDILGVFSLEEYTHMSPGRGALLWCGFISSILALSFVVQQTYPDRPSAPKEYQDGLEAELGGPHAVRAWKAGDELYIRLCVADTKAWPEDEHI